MDLERIGPYIIDHKIGSGGMGTVFLAQQAETGEDVALKVLPPELAREEGFVVRFEREIESLRKLVNPHVVALLDSGVDENTYYYAMEYVEGETLTDRLRRDKRIPWRDVVKYSLQICSALKAAHDAGIVHRDLKPSNLLLDKDNNIKLTDFGVAQVFASGRLTVTGGIIGTAEYMSPEQAKGQRATKKSDLYSLGAVMFTMLTGRPPFVGKSTLEVIQKHKYGQFDRPSRYVEGIPRRLEETVCQLLHKEPDKRFPDALVLSRKLEQIVRRADVANQEETRIAKAQPPGEGNSATMLLQDESEQPQRARRRHADAGSGPRGRRAIPGRFARLPLLRQHLGFAGPVRAVDLRRRGLVPDARPSGAGRSRQRGPHERSPAVDASPEPARLAAQILLARSNRPVPKANDPRLGHRRHRQGGTGVVQPQPIPRAD